MTTTVRPRNPLELAVVLPYQLGYHPQRSVVLLHQHGVRLGMLQRHDVIDAPDACRVIAGQALAVAVRERATGLLVLAFEDDAGECRPLLDAMSEAAATAGVALAEPLVVRDGLAHSVERGRPVVRRLPRPRDVPAVAAFVHAGVHPLPSREDFLRGALPERDEARAARVGRAEPAARTRVDARGVAWGRLLDPCADAVHVAELTDEEIHLLATSLQDVQWRDALMAVLCPGTTPFDALDGQEVDLALLAAAWCPWTTDPGEHHEEREVLRARLGELTRYVPLELSPPLLTCLGIFAWWGGDGTVAGTCFERALEIEPGYTLAGLLMRALAAGLRPWALPEEGDVAA